MDRHFTYGNRLVFEAALQVDACLRAGIEPPRRAKYALLLGLSNPLILQASPPFASPPPLERKNISSFYLSYIWKCTILCTSFHIEQRMNCRSSL